MSTLLPAPYSYGVDTTYTVLALGIIEKRKRKEAQKENSQPKEKSQRKNKSEILAQKKLYYEKNKPKILARVKHYQKVNRKKINAQVRARKGKKERQAKNETATDQT